ncbi:MAG: hypothetical protein LN417_01625 [Candidatus Thermoplasmatota archaeon]|nr:hypothetical protein [Candidatus Thermoplasmatota archaeon]
MKDNDSNQMVFIIMVIVLIVLVLSFVGLAFGAGTWGFGMMGFSPFFMLFPVLLLILIVILIARAIDSGPRIYQVPQTHSLPSVDPGHVARERYARGEISRDEFLRIIQDLREAGPQGS